MIQDVVLSLIARVFGMAAGVASSILTARALGVSGRGEYFYVITLATSATQFGNLGLASTNTYSLARDTSLLPRLAANSLWVSATVGITFAAGLVAFERIVANGSWTHRPTLLAALIVPPLLYRMLGANLLVGLSRIRLYNIFDCGASAFQLVSIGTAAGLKLEVSAFLAVTAGTTWVAAIVLWLTLARLQPVRWGFDYALLRANVGYAGRAYVAALLAYSVSRAGVFVLGALAGKADVGVYSVAVQFGDSLILIPATVAMVLFPNLMKGPPAVRFQRTRQAALHVVIVMAVLCVATAVVAPWLVPRVFGRGFAASVPVLWWMLPGVMAVSVTSIFSQYLAARGIPIASVWIWGLGLGAVLCCCRYLVPMLGATGAAISLSATYAGLGVALTGLAWKHSHDDLARANLAETEA